MTTEGAAYQLQPGLVDEACEAFCAAMGRVWPDDFSEDRQSLIYRGMSAAVIAVAPAIEADVRAEVGMLMTTDTTIDAVLREAV